MVLARRSIRPLRLHVHLVLLVVQLLFVTLAIAGRHVLLGLFGIAANTGLFVAGLARTTPSTPRSW